MIFAPISASVHGVADSWEFAAPDFHLERTLNCGQVFHWQPYDSGYVGLIGEVPIFAQQSGAVFVARRLTPNARKIFPAKGAEVVSRYFALDHPLAEIAASFPEDPFMNAAAEFCRGLRILRQPAWECLATFITSSMKQVAHIRQISMLLRQRFGRPVSTEFGDLFTYPGPEVLAALDETDLRDCALGYRAKNLLNSARLIASGDVDLAQVAALEDDAARLELCRLPGVGVKVANCALLFAFERLRAFPIDVWIERVLRNLYFQKNQEASARELRAFAEHYFGPYGGYAQQYLFHHARQTWPRERRRS